MTIARKIETILSRSSWIRKMFEEGGRLKAHHGAQNVFDFSLGNPNIAAPECFDKALAETACSCSGEHGYMPNTGYPLVCRSVAEFLSKEQGVEVDDSDVTMTCGAAGALNIILKALLDPGDVRTIYLVGFAPNHYHENAVASVNAYGISRQAALRKMFRPVSSLISRMG